VRVFQDREGLTVNGAVDEETMSKIFDLITGSELDQENAKVDAILASSTPQVLTISDTSLNNSVGTTSTDSSTSNTSTQNTSSSVDPNSTDAVSSYLDQINQFLSVDLTPPTLTTILTPSAPTLSATTGALCGGNIDLNWSSGASGLSYLVMRDGVQILQTTNITFSDTGLSPGTVHTYTITATDGVNSSSSSNTASASASNLCTGTTTQTIKAPAPVISNISVSGVNQNSATITWNTDINSDGQVEYGKTVTYGTKTTINSQLLTTHSATLTGLTTKTTYHYAVISTSNGSIGTSTDKTFLTN
jgi:hypothetical protein